MWKQKLCVSLLKHYGPSIPEQMRIFAEAGFDGFFTAWEPDAPIAENRKAADALKMFYQSVHAPYGKLDKVWQEGEEGDLFLGTLTECLTDCAANEVGIMVCHAFIGFRDHSPTQIGLDRIGRLARRAEELGVKIAFENTEGEEYLAAILNGIPSPALGFCWDTGHEMCYNHTQDMPSHYGSRIIATHINDNLGIRSFDGTISPIDDLHLLPFDGIADWDWVAERLKTFDGPLTFELKRFSKPDRHDNDRYLAMTLPQYAAEAYARACRVAVKCLRAREKR